MQKKLRLWREETGTDYRNNWGFLNSAEIKIRGVPMGLLTIQQSGLFRKA
jgi:hypothetical protein